MYTKENAGMYSLDTILRCYENDQQPTTVSEVFAQKYPDSFLSEKEQALSEEKGYPWK